MRVTTMDAELEFAIQANTTGKQLFDQVIPNGTFISFHTVLLLKIMAQLKLMEIGERGKIGFLFESVVQATTCIIKWQSF